ncbi:MAG: hypothetical protein EZS28_014023 [Streblomastix strix]|uniref:Uncharacterized protein n=1 Tax=Streblomastix strix TaxID=222440 RepID=A0A5J4W6Y9_9EUKA|nr:MAG: hypothetical protein EZS28_014023 [Streblomastix strix]
MSRTLLLRGELAFLREDNIIRNGYVDYSQCRKQPKNIPFWSKLAGDVQNSGIRRRLQFQRREIEEQDNEIKDKEKQQKISEQKHKGKGDDAQAAHSEDEMKSLLLQMMAGGR